MYADCWPKIFIIACTFIKRMWKMFMNFLMRSVALALIKIGKLWKFLLEEFYLKTVEKVEESKESKYS